MSDQQSHLTERQLNTKLLQVIYTGRSIYRNRGWVEVDPEAPSICFRWRQRFSRLMSRELELFELDFIPSQLRGMM